MKLYKNQFEYTRAGIFKKIKKKTYNTKKINKLHFSLGAMVAMNYHSIAYTQISRFSTSDSGVAWISRSLCDAV